MKRENKNMGHKVLFSLSHKHHYKKSKNQRDFSTSDDQKTNQYKRIETNPVEEMKNKARPT